ncbi:MAG: hypothetical protein PHU69_12685 [Fermentimonas sp.]|nr:hypothetical protein [Fermentimonas sp.]
MEVAVLLIPNQQLVEEQLLRILQRELLRIHKHEMVLHGHRPAAEHILQIPLQVPANLSVIRTILGMEVAVLLIHNQQLVEERLLRIPQRELLHIHKHEMVLHGRQPAAEHILQIAPQVPVNLSVIRTILGMEALVLPVQEVQLVEERLQRILQRELLHIHKREMVLLGHRPIIGRIPQAQHQESVNIPVIRTTLGTEVVA